MPKKGTKLENLSKTNRLVEEIRISELDGLDHIFMESYMQQVNIHAFILEIAG